MSPKFRELPAVLLAFLVLGGCASSKEPAEHCSQEQTQEWQYQPSWMVRPVSVSEAKEIVRDEIGFDLDKPASQYEIQYYHQAWDGIIEAVNSGGQIWRVNAPPGTLGPSGLAVLKECKIG